MNGSCSVSKTAKRTIRHTIGVQPRIDVKDMLYVKSVSLVREVQRWRKEAHCTFYTEGWHRNLRVHYLESHLTSEMSEVLMTLQKEGQHLILCPTSSSILFCVHPIQPRLDKAKWFWGDFQSTWNGSAAINKDRALQQETEVGRSMPQQATGSHVAILERTKSAQAVSGNCMEEEDEPRAFLSTTLTESSSYSKLSSSKVNPHLVKPSVF